MSESGVAPRVADVRLSAFERVPWRRIITTVLAVVIGAIAPAAARSR